MLFSASLVTAKLLHSCLIQTAVGYVRDARPNSTNQPLSRQAKTRMRVADKPLYGASLAAR